MISRTRTTRNSLTAGINSQRIRIDNFTYHLQNTGTNMNTRKMRKKYWTVTETKESVVVVLNGTKVLLEEKSGIAPLTNALKDVVVGLIHEVLILIILDIDGSLFPQSSSPQNVSFCCIGDKTRKYSPREEKAYGTFLRQEKLQREELYRQILRPHRDSCRSKGVAFEVKFAVGSQLQNLIVEEANTVKASKIVMDRCLATNLSFQFKGTACNVSLVTEDEAMLVHVHMPQIDRSKRSVDKSGFLKADILESLGTCSPYHPDTLIPSTSSGSENMKPTVTQESSKYVLLEDTQTEKTVRDGNNSFEKISEASLVQHSPLQLSWDVIADIAQGFRKRCGWKDTCPTHVGYFEKYQSTVIVMKCEDDSEKVLRAEKRAAMTMHHRNIFPLVGYHKSEDATYLVFPYASRLDRYLFGSREKKVKTLTFPEKVKIAIEVAQGLRYMHEECPNGPVIHGNIRPSNIFLKDDDLQPQISGFAQSAWLHSEQTCSNRSEDTSGSELHHLDDIFSFGILLLRLFCQRPIPQDDKRLIEWARPLMIEHKFHEILGEHTDDVNIHEVFRVLCAATQCTQTMPTLRPQMSEVLRFLKGETFCCLNESPPDRDG